MGPAGDDVHRDPCRHPASPPTRWRIRWGAARAAIWTAGALVVVRRRCARDGVRAQAPRCWRRMPAQSAYGMWLVLDRQAPTCLERALLLQEWRSAHGVRTDVLIGVPAEGLGSRDIHAWVEGSRDVDASSYQIIHRVAARAA